MNIRQRTWEIVEAAKPGDRVSRAFDVGMMLLIGLNLVAVIAGSVTEVERRWGGLLNGFELVSVMVFTLEYVLRLWSCTVDPRFGGAVRGRLRLAVQPLSVVDLLAIAPFYLPFFGVDMRTLRLLRLLRLLRVAKMGRYYASLTLMRDVLREKREELVLTTALMGFLLIVAASLLYHCEYEAQPEAFSSIPAAMWWAVTTLTTVGYGDLYPVTVAGKVIASGIAFLGIGMFALPAGILGAGFVEAVEKRKTGQKCCPHCGKNI